MAYRVNAQFMDGTTSGPLADVVASVAPRCGDTLNVSRRGTDVPVLVTAVWTPTRAASRNVEGLAMVEAREI